MLVELGTIVGIYCFVRLCALATRRGDRRESEVTIFLALVGMIGIGLLTAALWMHGSGPTMPPLPAP